LASANLNKFALFAARRPSIGNIITNCTLSETHGEDYDISDAPIEDGSHLTDNRIKRPTVLEMVGVFSPYPDNIIDQVRDGANADTKATWARILALANSSEPFDVYTVLRLYKGMQFSSFRHTEQGENVIILNAILRHIEVAKTQSDLHLADDIKNNLSAAEDVGNPATSPA